MELKNYETAKELIDRYYEQVFEKQIEAIEDYRAHPNDEFRGKREQLIASHARLLRNIMRHTSDLQARIEQSQYGDIWE